VDTLSDTAKKVVPVHRVVARGLKALILEQLESSP
jgi:hypothetical protein